MNYQFLGNSYSLMNNDSIIQLCKAFSVPLLYAPMLTLPRPKNKEDSHMINYRLGSKNLELLDLMKIIYSKEDAGIKDISDLFRKYGINIRTIGSENDSQAGHSLIDSNPFFSHKEREQYFEGILNLIADSEQQLIFLDPDTGIGPIGQDIPRAKGSAFVLTSELRNLINKTADNSIVAVRQAMNNPFYSQEQRINDMHKELGANIILLVDEVIQSGLFIITKSEVMNRAMLNRLQYYLSDYKVLKKGSRILLGNNEGDRAIIGSIGTFVTEE